MGLGIPPLSIKIMFESNPLKPTIVVGRLGVLINCSDCWNPLFRDPLTRHMPCYPYSRGLYWRENLCCCFRNLKKHHYGFTGQQTFDIQTICICYMCVYMCIYICTCMYVYIYIYIHICISLSLSLYIYIYIHIYTYTHYIYIYIYIYLYVCMYVCVYIYIYIHTYISRPRGDRKFGGVFVLGCLGGDFGEPVLKEQRSERARLD